MTPDARAILANLTPSERAEAVRLLRSAKARRDLATWCEIGPPTPRGPYRPASWHRHLCGVLEGVSAATRAGEAPRLIVTAPPQHGKSEIVARRWPLWHLAKHHQTVALASYSADLAVDHSRAAREMSTWEGYRDAFDSLERREVDRSEGYRRADVDRVDNWRVGGGGRYIAVGVGGSLTGRSPHLIVIDDPFKDAGAAYSKATRDAVWEWFSSVVLSRALANGSGIVVMHTRWHEDDLVGRLMAEQTDRWQVLNYRLEAEADDPLGRPVGAPLDPAVMGPDRVADMKKTMIPRDVAALYQQRPSPAGGALIMRDWLSCRYDLAPTGQRMQCDRVVMGVDLAFRGAETSDYCAAVVVGAKDAQRFVLHVERAHLDYPAQREMVRRLAREWACDAVVVERAANGDALIAELGKVVPGLRGERATRDKVQRLNGSGLLEAMHAGQVLFPRAAPWWDAFQSEALSFPASPNDDQVDALVWAMVAARGGTWTVDDMDAAIAML